MELSYLVLMVSAGESTESEIQPLLRVRFCLPRHRDGTPHACSVGRYVVAKSTLPGRTRLDGLKLWWIVPTELLTAQHQTRF